MITRYTTPYHDFILPFKVEQVNSLYITYSQNGETVFEKSYPEDGEIHSITFINVGEFLDNASMGDEYGKIIEVMSDENSSLLTLHLSQDDTSLFKVYPAAEKNIAKIQIRIKDKNDEAFVCRVIRDRVFDSQKEDII